MKQPSFLAGVFVVLAMAQPVWATDPVPATIDTPTPPSTRIEIPLKADYLDELNLSARMSAYRKALKSQVAATWQPPESYTGGRFVVLVHISKMGKLLDTDLFQSSGNPTLDSAAIEAIQASAPFTPLPAAYTGESRRFTLSFHGSTASSMNPYKADFGPYLQDVEKKTLRNWHPPMGIQNRSVVTVSVIDRQGKLLNTAITESSGIGAIDSSALDAMRQSAPFEALPADYPDEFVVMENTFNYKVWEERNQQPTYK